MVKAAKHDKSESLEILSIGKLYSGPWDKKYWSSSRGKYRYPYPVGYKLLRHQNGVNYTMEVLEGLKGPSFAITSSDGKACFGDTPDMAWKNFLKLCHGKRPTGKEGVEFFGFTNSLLQRLLRELVANVDGAVEQKSLSTSVIDGAREAPDQLNFNAPSTEGSLLKDIRVSYVRRKRTKRRKLGDNETVDAHPKQHEEHTNNACGLDHVQRDQINHGCRRLTVNEFPLPVYSPRASTPQIICSVVENGNQVPFGELDDSKVGKELQHREAELPVSSNADFRLNNDEFLEFQEPNGISHNTEGQGCDKLMPGQTDEVANVEDGLLSFTDANGYAPDTLECAAESFSTLSPKNNDQGDWNLESTSANVLAMSDTLVNDSVPEDLRKAFAAGSSSELCDSDSVEQDVTTSMMTVLLPRALPLLKTFSKRKKKLEKPPKYPVMEPANNSDMMRQNEVACDQSATLHHENAGFADCGPAMAAGMMSNLTQYPDAGFSDCNISSDTCATIAHIDDAMKETCKTNDELTTNVRTTMRSNNKLEGLIEYFASYLHPMPILMVQLFYKERDIFFCVTCGYSDQGDSELFMYKTTLDGEGMGFPSLIGHAPINLPIGVLGGNVSVRRCLLHLTPDARSLVLLNGVKTSYCSLGKLHCSCPVCTPSCFKKSGVKIVRLKSGFVSVVKVLETTQVVRCLLVCEPNCLLAAEGGKLNLWTMNSEWSQPEECSSLPTCDSMLPCIMDLKLVPNSAALVVGHNGLGEFQLWDIHKRSSVSRFSSFPSLSVSECLPINVFRWKKRPDCKANTLSEEIMDATSKRLPWENDPSEDKDVGVWLLISTAPDLDADYYHSPEQLAVQAQHWRLALLANNTVITGSVIDKGIAAVTSSGHGIIARDDGLVYAWELSTGMKLGNIHSFGAGSVSCISSLSTIPFAAVAAGDQLLLYMPS